MIHLRNDTNVGILAHALLIDCHFLINAHNVPIFAEIGFSLANNTLLTS